MLTPLDFYRTMLCQPLKASDETLVLLRGARVLDDVGIGNYTYLVMVCDDRSEVVKYTHTENYEDRKRPNEILVQRDYLNRGRKNFPPGTSVSFQWFGKAISEFINQSAL